MNIICYRKLLFIRDEIVEDRRGEATQRILAECTVSPSASAQSVPDWIRDTDLFKLAVEDGAIVEQPVHY
jgi:hypothetical protein